MASALAMLTAGLLLAGEPFARIRELHYASTVLHRDMPLTVVLPDGYRADGPPVPVVVWLHGSGRNHRTLLDSEATRAMLLAAPFAVVMPEGRQGWYVDSPVDPDQAWQQALTEAIAVADQQFSVRRDRAGRGLGGWSMGGYGAAWYAVSFPEGCGSLATILGCLDFPNAELPREQNHSVPDHFGPVEGWPGLNPLHRVDRLAGMRLWHGTGRSGFDFAMNEHWHARLTELGFEHDYKLVDDGHTFEVVERLLPEALAFFAAGFGTGP